MKPEKRLTHRFVENIPDDIEEDTLYVCIQFATVVHKCCSGCGREVVTPLSPTDWSLSFDGKTVSLYPSIGNWSFPCQSHYWIRSDRVVWVPRLSQAQIEHGRARDREAKSTYFEGTLDTTRQAASAPIRGRGGRNAKSRIKAWFSKAFRSKRT